MNSLKNVYNYSVIELKQFLNLKVEEPDIYFLREKTNEIKSTVEPLFSVYLQHQFKNVSHVKQLKLEPFMLPPSGTNKIQDFKILAQVNLRTVKKDKTTKVIDDGSDY